MRTLVADPTVFKPGGRRAGGVVRVDGTTAWVRRAAQRPLVSDRLFGAGGARYAQSAASAARFWTRVLDGLREGVGQHRASRRLDGRRERTGWSNSLPPS